MFCNVNTREIKINIQKKTFGKTINILILYFYSKISISNGMINKIYNLPTFFFINVRWVGCWWVGGAFVGGSVVGGSVVGRSVIGGSVVGGSVEDLKWIFKSL